MKNHINGAQFAELFKKYRLRSEINSLSYFGDLLSQEGLVYETSLFTRWQTGSRIPKDRRTLLAIIKVFSKRMGITIESVNKFLEASGQGYLTETEKEQLPLIIDNNFQPKVLQVSLGGLLKDYRTQKNISELEVSLDLGFEDVKIIQQIENGYLRPERDILDRICKALSLKEQEKNYLLLVGDYLPTEEEINQTRQKVQPILDEWPYPAVLLDYSWRVISDNKANYEMWEIPLESRNLINKANPRVIELLFNPNIPAIQQLDGENLKKWYEWIIEALVHFRYAQQNRVKAEWYISFIKKMMKNELFRNLWQQSLEVHKDMIVTNHGDKFIYSTQKAEYINLFFSVVPLLTDPRFSIEFHSPVDLKSFEYFNSKN